MMLLTRTGFSLLTVKMSEETYIPMWLLAELTYACPVQCPYCSNPLQISASRKQELSTEEWFKVLSQARKLGAVQLGFSGGEPLLRQDLVDLLREANRLGFYTNLITSAIGLTQKRSLNLKRLVSGTYRYHSRGPTKLPISDLVGQTVSSRNDHDSRSHSPGTTTGAKFCITSP